MRIIRFHIFFWLLYFLYAYISDYFLYPEIFFWDELVQTITHPVLIFYLSLYFLSHSSFSSILSALKSLLLLAGIILAFGLVKYGYRAYFLPAFHFPPYTPLKWRSFIADGIIWFVHFFIWALGYYFASRLSSRQKEYLLEKQEHDELIIQRKELTNKNLELQSQNLRLQNEKLRTEYAFLKAQINPHFLYNTLGFFYAKVLPADKQTAEGISLLTDIMRYSLHQGEGDGKVGLEDEITNLNNYILLQQMRFNNTLNIQFTNTLDGSKYRILPHILITLVENAFKHGEVNNPLHPLGISLTEQGQDLVFIVRNKIRNGPVDGHTTGVGLNNIRNRVHMVYGDRAAIESVKTNDYFSVTFLVALSQLVQKTGPPE